MIGSDDTCSLTHRLQRKKVTWLLELTVSSVMNICELQLGHFILRIPELVRRSIASCNQITIYCGMNFLNIQYVVVVSISQGRDFFYYHSEIYATKFINYFTNAR